MNPACRITNNLVWVDDRTDGRIAIMTSNADEYDDALLESDAAMIYISPALISVNKCTILAGKHAARWEMVAKWFERWDRLVAWYTG